MFALLVSLSLLLAAASSPDLPKKVVIPPGERPTKISDKP